LIKVFCSEFAVIGGPQDGEVFRFHFHQNIPFHDRYATGVEGFPHPMRIDAVTFRGDDKLIFADVVEIVGIVKAVKVNDFRGTCLINIL
jgi:hypothetical protein